MPRHGGSRDARVRHPPERVKLTGLLVVGVGLALRLKPTLVVVAATLLTGVLAGIPLLMWALIRWA